MEVRLATSATACALPTVQRLRLFDADALAEAVRSSRFEHVQLERGDFQADLKRIDFGDSVVDSGCYTRKVLARGDFPPGSITLGCILDSREEGQINGYRFNRHDIVIFPVGAELDYVQPAGTRWCAIPLSETLLEQAGCQDIRIDRIKVMPGNWPLTRLMRCLLSGLSADLMAGVTYPVAPSSLQNAKLTVLLTQIREVLHRYTGDQNVRRPSLQKRMAMVRHFERRVSERIDEVVPISELCRELGVSQRVLEYVFKDDIGMTPKKFSDVLRLNAFRCELLRGGPENRTLTQIAQRYGINHLGRLSAAYRRQFGELPSETLRR